MTEEPFMMKPGISSITTDFEGFNLLTALQISASETGARGMRETGKVDGATVVMN
jgi:hypothetical protein